VGRLQSLKLVQDKSPSESRYKELKGEFWAAQQRRMHSLHYVVNYRDSFKPELPDFCIKRYSAAGDIVLDPFAGRGTTALQANLLGRVAWARDIEPLAVQFTKAKTAPVGLDEIVLRLNEVDFLRPVSLRDFRGDLSPFYHPDTYRELVNLRTHIARKRDVVNDFIELLVVSRLHGHSKGYFSAYTFAEASLLPERQVLLNRKRHCEPDYRPVAPRIIKRAAEALRDGFSTDFFEVASSNNIAISDARAMRDLPPNSVDLIVTSPPLPLDDEPEASDMWIEFWFTGLRRQYEELGSFGGSGQWRKFISEGLREMLRVLKPRCYAVIEAVETSVGSEQVELDRIITEEAEKLSAGQKRFVVDEVLVNQQKFSRLKESVDVDSWRGGSDGNKLVVLRSMPTRTNALKAERAMKK